MKFTIFSLLLQKSPPKKIILYLAESQFPGKKIPKSLQKLTRFENFEITWCEDIKSYKKLLPTLKRYPDETIVIADDDMYYHPTWLLELWQGHLLYPNAICTHWSYVASLKPRNTWKETEESCAPRLCNFAIGSAGVLYPPNCLHPDIFDLEKIFSLAPIDDDLYFWAMAVLVDTPTLLVENARKRHENPSILHHETPTLSEQNGTLGKGQIQFNNVIKHYPELCVKLKEPSMT
ncbi:glycosyltransferase family A protein [Helicobacter mustelae]|uniref:glycosyltransferase family A protein n=1 Tax=Helicobacter mustelae TaxID=217 RepID=UPI0003214E52|nr:glycosyltransferase family A protein [Helicobacter mustelae]